MQTEEQIIEASYAPISVTIATRDIQVLYAMQTSPQAFNQLILAKLKDAGAPVEGVLNLRLAHGQVFKVKTAPHQPLEGFQYIWYSDEHAAIIQQSTGVH